MSIVPKKIKDGDNDASITPLSSRGNRIASHTSEISGKIPMALLSSAMA
jgi:hypothetical protein